MQLFSTGSEDWGRGIAANGDRTLIGQKLCWKTAGKKSFLSPTYTTLSVYLHGAEPNAPCLAAPRITAYV